MRTKVKTFVVTQLDHLDNEINEWVDQTHNHIVDLRLLETSLGTVVVVVYMTQGDLNAMISPASMFEGFDKGADGDNILDLSEFEDTDDGSDKT